MAGKWMIYSNRKKKTACAPLVWAADFICSGSGTKYYSAKAEKVFFFLVCYFSYINVFSHAVQLLLDHPAKCVHYWKCSDYTSWKQSHATQDKTKNHWLIFSVFPQMWRCPWSGGKLEGNFGEAMIISSPRWVRFECSIDRVISQTE